MCIGLRQLAIVLPAVFLLPCDGDPGETVLEGLVCENLPDSINFWWNHSLSCLPDPTSESYFSCHLDGSIVSNDI
jgi:hypothetical protein